MDDDLSRTSLASTSSRGEDWTQGENRNLQRKFDAVSSELYELKRALPFLEQISGSTSDQSVRTLAARCAELSDERDALLRDRDQTETQLRNKLQRKTSEVSSLQKKLHDVEQERNAIYDKCIQLERQLEDDHSAHFQTQLSTRSGPIESALPARRQDELRTTVDRLRKAPTIKSDEWSKAQLERVLMFVEREHRVMDEAKRKVLEHLGRSVASTDARQSPTSYVQDRSKQLRPYFSNMDESASDSSRVSRSSFRPSSHRSREVIVEHEITVNRSVDSNTPLAPSSPRTTEYKRNLQLLLDQLKTTAGFLVDLLGRSGCTDDEQIRSLVAKISGMRLRGGEISATLLDDSRQLNESLEGICRSFEPNARRTTAPSPSESMLRSKNDAIAALRTEKDALWNENHGLVAENNELQRRVCELELDHNAADEKLKEALHTVEAQCVELQNRSQIIDALKQHLSEMDEKLSAHDDVQAEVERLRAQLAKRLDAKRKEKTSASPKSPPAKERSTFMSVEYYHMQEELRSKTQKFDELCAAFPKAEIRQEDEFDKKVKKLLAYVRRLIAYVDKTKPMMAEVGKMATEMQGRVQKGAKEDGFQLPKELFDPTALAKDDGRSSVAQLADYLHTLALYCDSIVKRVKVAMETNLSDALTELIRSIFDDSRRLSFALSKAKEFFEKNRTNKVVLRGMEKEISTELGRIHATLRPRTD